MPSRCHDDHLPARVAQHARAERLDHPGLLGDGNELGRRNHAAHRVAPAQQRLHGAGAARLQVDLRLVGEKELVLQQAAPHVRLELQPRLHARIHVGRVEPVRVAADLLGRVHRGVGLLDQRDGVVGVEREHRNPDRARQRGRLVGQAEGHQERLPDPGQHRHRLEGRMRGVETRQDHHELVAAQARNGIGLADGRGEALGHRLQQLVAGIVAERVVDALEMVEVEEQARDVRGVALRLREDLLQPLVEERPVRQPREDVVLRELVGVRRRDLELVRALRDFLLQRALVIADLRLRLGEALRHVVERVREEPELVGGGRGDEHVELARRPPRAPRASAGASARRGLA